MGLLGPELPPLPIGFEVPGPEAFVADELVAAKRAHINLLAEIKRVCGLEGVIPGGKSLHSPYEDGARLIYVHRRSRNRVRFTSVVINDVDVGAMPGKRDVLNIKHFVVAGLGHISMVETSTMKYSNNEWDIHHRVGPILRMVGNELTVVCGSAYADPELSVGLSQEDPSLLDHTVSHDRSVELLRVLDDLNAVSLVAGTTFPQ